MSKIYIFSMLYGIISVDSCRTFVIIQIFKDSYFFYFQQFLFSDRTVKFLKGLIQKIGVKRVLCIGTPRLVLFNLSFD